MADQNGTAAPKARDPDFYAGFTRFEIECEVFLLSITAHFNAR